MKNIDKLIEQLKDKNIHLSLKNGNISVKSTESKISSEITGIIKSNKNEILKYLKRENDYKTFESIYPLSPMQEGMLFHSLYSSTSEVYMNQMALDFIGELNIPAFNAAWQAIIEKHTIFRTSFVSHGVSKPLQRVHKFVKCNVEKLNFTEFKEEEIQTKLDSLQENDRKKGFDLTKAPLSKFKLIKISENKYRFIWTNHHILTDGWCSSIIFKEFYENYHAVCNGEEIKIENIDKYEDFIAYLGEQDQDKAEEFWKNYLKGFENPTPIPIGNNNQKADETDTYKKNGTSLSIEDTKLLNDFSKEHHLTVNTLVQSAWSLLLSRYSGENDIVFGMTVSGRPASLPGVEEKVGLFINTLPLRVKVDGNQNVIEWLTDLQEQQPLLREYEYIPLVKIQSLSEVSNSENLFNSIFVLQNYPIGESGNAKNSSLRIENVQFFEKTNYPLSISASIGNNLAINIWYNNTIYSTEIIEQTLGHFREVLLNIIKHAEKPLSDIEILTPAEKHQLLVEWNDTKADYPKDKCIHQLFEEQVEKTPANIAVVFENKQLTYQELNEKSNQLAHYLQSKGVKPDALVGICVDRSLEMIIGLLGILKAGGAYVPIDPTYPDERISYMLKDADCEIVLSQKHLKLPETNSEIIYLDADWDKIENEPAVNVKSGVKSNNLAYVIYTSGSTGKPKGVMIEHAGICNLQQEQVKIFNIVENDIVLQFASFSFDASVSEIFMAFSKSAKLILSEKEKLGDAVELTKLIDDYKINVVTLPPTMLNLLNNNLPTLKTLISAGEICNTELVRKWAKNVAFYNAYGPTENTVCASIYKCNINDVNSLSIGKALGNNKLYVLDSSLDLVPIGVVGELCISGEQLGTGLFKTP
jgi:amino acid adenylation domain-containing protein